MKLMIENGAVELNGEMILSSINFEIHDSQHTAIVGRNGSGKTTLVKAIIDNSMLSEGIDDVPLKIEKSKNLKIGYLEQIKLDEELTLYQEISKSFDNLIKMEKEIEELSTRLDNDNNILKYSELLDRFNILGGYTYKSEIESMIRSFGFNNEKDKVLKNFSGGEKMKISFMKLLLSDNDLLILDEPTNHLDMNTIEWLENYLKNYKKAFIVISHDRMFLDNTVNVIYDIEYGETKVYKGNYSKYVEVKQQNYLKQLKDYESQQKEIKRLNDLYLRFRFKPKKAGMALSKLKQIERMDKIDKPLREDRKTFKTNFKNIEKPGREVLTLKNLEFGYDKVLGSIDYSFIRGKKIAIIGPNGSGKSTLLKTMYGLIHPLSGKVQNGYNVHNAYFDQNLNFETNGTILEEFMNKYPKLSNEEARHALGAFMFSGIDVDKKLNILSGGEKVRLLLCEIFFGKPNLLFLDEPTNHLDIIGKEALEDTIKSYPETIIFVSHDRYFVNKIADEVIAFTDNGLKIYKYGYQEYLEKRDKEVKQVIEKKDVKKKEPIIKGNKDIHKIEKEVEEINNKIKKINEELYNCYDDYEKSNSLSMEIKELEEKIKIKEKEWENLVNK